MKMKNSPRKSIGQKILDILQSNKLFLQECKKSRKRFLKTTSSKILANGTKHIYKWNDKVLNEETRKIMDRFAILPSSWEGSIIDYIKTGKLVPPASTTEPQVVSEIAEPGRYERLSIQIFKYTTKKEYIAKWPAIKKLQVYLSDQKPKPISGRDLDILRLYQIGKTDREIADELYEKGEEMDESNIRQIISRLAPLLSIKRKNATRKR